MKEILAVIWFPWLILCRVFNIGKFTRFETDYPKEGDDLYGVEPWQTNGIGNHAKCERKGCPYKCIFYNR